MTANLVTVFIVGLVVGGMILGAIDSRPHDLGDPLFSGPRSGPPRRSVRQLTAGGLEHTIVVAPHWHPFTEPNQTSSAQMLRGIRIAAAFLLRTLLRRREWTVAVLRQQTNPVRYHEHLVKETHPSRDAAFARAAEITRALTAGEPL